MSASTPPQTAIDAAIAVANRGPCAKSKRGVVAYRVQPANPFARAGDCDDKPSAYVVARGHNAPPRGFACDGSDACKAACAKVCIHAEQAVLASDFFGERFGPPAYLVHVKTVDGLLVPSGGPSCWQCSRQIVDDARVAGIWLYHVDGWRFYESAEFHELTLRECGLPVVVKEARP